MKAWQFKFISLQNCSTYSYFQKKESNFSREISGKWKRMLEVVCTRTRDTAVVQHTSTSLSLVRRLLKTSDTRYSNCQFPIKLLIQSKFYIF